MRKRIMLQLLAIMLLASIPSHAVIYGDNGVIERFTFDITRLTESMQDGVDNAAPCILQDYPYLTWINSNNEVKMYRGGTTATLGIGYFSNCLGDNYAVDNSPKPVLPLDEAVWIGPSQSDPEHSSPQVVGGHTTGVNWTIYESEPGTYIKEFDNDGRMVTAVIQGRADGSDAVFYRSHYFDEPPNAPVEIDHHEVYGNGGSASHIRLCASDTIVWQGNDMLHADPTLPLQDRDDEIFSYNPKTNITMQLTNNSLWDCFPEIAYRQGSWNDNIVWVASDQAPQDGMPFVGDIMYYNGSETKKIGYGREPMVTLGGEICWTGSDGHDEEIFMYYDTTGELWQVTNNNYDDFDPFVTYYGDVVWSGFDGSNNEIFIADRYHQLQVTTSAGINNYDPMMDVHGDIVWLGNNGSYNDIYFSENRWYYENDDPSAEPVPEPSSIIMLGTGFIGMLGFKLRRAKMR